MIKENRPDYADFDSAAKFTAIQSIIGKRLKEHPKAICSYSGGSDSDIMLDLIERTREIFNLPPVAYVFFNTGLEMKATKNHVKATAQKYGVEIEEVRPKINIVQSTRKYGIPFVSKSYSEALSSWQKRKNIPFRIREEYNNATDKKKKYLEFVEKYPKSKQLIRYIIGCDSKGCESKNNQLKFPDVLMDFLEFYRPDFRISAKCCDYCKKQPAHEAQKGFDMIITGERFAEGGNRTTSFNSGGTIRDESQTPCFFSMASGQFRLRPLYYVTDKDKAWYKEYYDVQYSDAYEVYGLTRTGCCGCPISYKAVDDLEKIWPYEPNVVKAAWNIFGKSYEYRRKYNEYKKEQKRKEKE